MNIIELDINDFLAHVRSIDMKLGEAKTAEKLLDEVVDDFPAARTLLIWMRKVAVSKKRKKRRNKKLLLTMERDFLVLLALREMDKEASEGAGLATDVRARLRFKRQN